MKLGIISDIHGNIHALRAVLEALDNASVDLIVCAGDLVCCGANHNLVIRQIRQRHIPTVTGHYDAAVAWGHPVASYSRLSSQAEFLQRAALAWTNQYVLAEDKAFLQTLPWRLNYNIDGQHVVILHGGLDRLDESFTPSNPTGLQHLAEQLQADIVILGHSHVPFTYGCHHSQGQTLFINPGSVGHSHDGDPRASYALLDTRTDSVQFARANYNIEAAARAIAVSGMPIEIAEMIRQGVAVEDLMLQSPAVSTYGHQRLQPAFA